MTQQYFFCATSSFALQGGCNFQKYTLILLEVLICVTTYPAWALQGSHY